MSEQYKISLGVDVDVSDIQSQINTKAGKLDKIPIKVEIENLKELKSQIQDLGKDNKNALTLDTSSIEKSLDRLSNTITDIKASFDTLDSKSGMKSLLSSVNQIATALGKVENESDNLVKSLSALSKKDFSINFDLKMGKSASQISSEQGDIKRDAISQLKQQAKALEDYLDQYYKVAQRQEGVVKLTQGTNLFGSFWEMSSSIGDTKASLKQQVSTYKQYIDLMQEAAKIKGIDLSSVTSGFSKTTNDIVEGTKNVANDAEEVKQALKGIFGGGLDVEGLSGQLQPIITDLNEIKTAIQSLSSNNSIDGLTQSFNRLSETLEKLTSNLTLAKNTLDTGFSNTSSLEQIENVEEKIARTSTTSGTGFESVKNDLREIAIEADNTSDAIQSMRNAMSSMKFNNSSIDAVTKDLEEMDITIKDVAAKEKNGVIDITVKGVNEAKEAVTVVKRLNDETDNFDVISTKISKPFDEGTEAAKRFKKEAELVENIKFDFEVGKYDDGLSKMEVNYNKLSSASKELRENVEQVRNAYRELELAYEGTGDEVADKERLIQAEKEYAKALQTTNNLIRVQARTERADSDRLKLDDDIKLFQADIDKWLVNNSAATKKFGSQMLDLRAKAEGVDRVTLNGLIRQFKLADKQAEKLGLKTQSVGDKIKTKFKEYASYLSAAEMFMYAEQAFRSMFEQVKLIDSAMTELKKVTDETNESYNRFLTNAASRAKEIGTTIDGLVSSTADFARLGYGFKDAQGLAEVANIYAVVGDEIEGVEGATESLISTMAAFKDEANNMNNADFAMSIVDKFNEIGNNFAISSGGIGEALERSASSLDAANNTIDESISLITASNQVVQDPATVGQALKTISMRIRGAKTEMEEMGEDTEGMVDSTAKLRSEIMALSGVDIMKNPNEFKSTYQIMDELAAKWQDLTDIQQASITELIAGKRQGNIVSSLMNNFDVARDALETSLNSSGSAMAEHEKWSQSLEAQLLKLQAAWQGLSQAFLSSDFLKVALDSVINLVDGLTKLIDTFGTLPTLLGAVAAGMSLFKNKGLFTFDKDVKSIQLLGTGITDLKDKYTQIQTAIDRYNSISSKSVSFQEKYNKAMSNSSSSMGKYLSGLNGTRASFGGYIGSLIGATVKTIALEAATIALNAALTMGISFLISTGISAITKWANASEELAEKVNEVTSKFKEQHSELLKLKDDYDTSSESSMISKYEKLSKGVDGLGRNVSLTADEYSEYQSIVNTIADQIPNLVSGYNSQGDAILSCKDNVNELTEAYEKLIHAQNTEILTSTGDIEKDFANTLEKSSGEHWWSNGHGFWKGLIQRTGGGENFLTRFADYELKTDTVKLIEKLFEKSVDGSDKYDKDKIFEQIKSNRFSESEIRTMLESANVDIGYWDNPIEVLEKTLETDPAKIKNAVDNYYEQFAEAVEEQKTIAQAKLSEAFDISSAISGLNYENISEELQAVARQTVNSLDFDFFSELQEQGISVEQWTDKMLEQLDNIDNLDKESKIDAAFDLQTQFNGGDISYGEYVKGLEDAGNLISDLASKGYLDSELENQLKLSIGLDEDGLVKGYHDLANRLADDTQFNMNYDEYHNLLDGLSADEVSVLIDLIPELSETDYKETASDIKAAIEREMMLQGLTFELNLEVEAAGIESLNTALAESVSATGLSSESISALKGRYADLESQGYDLSSMFEETSHGVHLNRQEFNKLEKAYATQKLNEVTGQLDEMQVAYDQLGEDIRNCTDPVEKSKLFSDRQLLAQRISEAATLASQYQGLTSTYNDWLAAEEAGQERDMYENVIKGFETIDDEISRGWLDDGTIEFLELLTGKNLSTAGIEKQKEAYDRLSKTIKNTSYSIRDFFTVDEDGNSTNAGVYNFLDAIGQLEEEKFGGKDVVKRDKDGNIISFDFELAGGDEAIAEALGVSEEIVQIMVRAADDAGFVVSLDGAYRQLADLQNEAKSAADYLHEIGKTDFEFDFNTSSVKDLKDQLTEAHKILDSKEFWNEDGTFNFNADGATEAMQIVSTLQAKLDKLTEDQYGIGLTVEEEKFEEPLENLQEYGHTIQKLNQLKLNPETNSDEIEKLNGELDDIAEYFANLDGDLKVDLGFEADDGIDEVKKKIENGEVKIPTVLDIQANMDKNIEDLRDLMLLNSGLLSEEQEKAIKIKLGIEVEADKVDTSDVDEKVDKAIGRSSKGYSSETVRKQNIEIIAKTMGVEDIDDLTSKLKGLDDKTIQAIAEVLGRTDVDSLKYTLDNLGAEDKLQLQVIAEAIGKGDVEGLQTAIGKLSPKTVEAIAKALGYDKVEDLKSAVANMDGNTVQAVAQALGLSDVNTLQITVNNMQGNTVDAKVNTSGQKEKIDTLQSWINGLKGKIVQIGVSLASGGKKKAAQRTGADPAGNDSDVNGTANVNGTTGRAYKQGSWGTRTSGTALVGELGRESLRPYIVICIKKSI